MLKLLVTLDEMQHFPPLQEKSQVSIVNIVTRL